MLAPTVGPGVPVAHLTHCGQVAERVGSARHSVVGLPRSTQHRVATAPSYVQGGMMALGGEPVTSYRLGFS